MKLPTTFSDDITQHGAWLISQNYLAKRTNFRFNPHCIAHTRATYEVRIVVNPKTGTSIEFI